LEIGAPHVEGQVEPLQLAGEIRTQLALGFGGDRMFAWPGVVHRPPRLEIDGAQPGIACNQS
jgi:hypothetical protein